VLLNALLNSGDRHYIPRMPRLLLHIGQPKTGTTTLQHQLHRQAETLLARGILYPATAQDWEQHSVLIPYLTGVETHTADCHFPAHWPGDGIAETSQLFWKGVRSQIRASRPDLVILSGEGFFTLQQPVRLRRMGRALGQAFDRIDVLAYLRSPQSLFASNYQQSLKMRGIAVRPRVQYYRPALEAYAAHGPGPLTLRRFARADLAGGDIVTDFASTFCPGLVSEPEKDLNQSFSAEALWVLESLAALRNTEGAPGEPDTPWEELASLVHEADCRLPGREAPRLTDSARELALVTCADVAWLRDAHDLVFADVDYDRAGTRPELPDTILPVDEVFHVDHARAEAVLEQMRNTASQPGGLLGKLQSGLRRTMRKAF